MNASKFVKGLLLMASIFFAAVQAGNVAWVSTIVSAILVGAGYYVKNYLSPSDSTSGTLSVKDIVSTLLLAVIAALSNSVSSLVVNGTIVWTVLGKEVISVVVTYLSTTFFNQGTPAVTTSMATATPTATVAPKV